MRDDDPLLVSETAARKLGKDVARYCFAREWDAKRAMQIASSCISANRSAGAVFAPGIDDLVFEEVGTAFADAGYAPTPVGVEDARELAHQTIGAAALAGMPEVQARTEAIRVWTLMAKMNTVPDDGAEDAYYDVVEAAYARPEEETG